MHYRSRCQGKVLSLLTIVSLCFSHPILRAAGAASGGAKGVENSVVKVFATMRYPDLYRPWTKRAPTESTGSGVVIERKRILSNAHVVLYASQVQIQANQSGEKISATVESIAPGIDLAVLKLDDESFFDKHPPMPRATTLPEIKDAVMTYGFPEGGSTLSITKGIVSRIEFTSYNFPVSGLRVQIDAAINPGNSGGPAVAGEKMIGLAFSHLGGAENIGYIIPCEEIELFLQDVRDGRYDGKPSLFDELQTLENPALRPFLKLDKSVEGIVVNKPESKDPDYPLKQWDVITHVGDTPIDAEGMIKVGPNLRVRFPYMFQKLAKDGQVPVTVMRSGKPIRVQLSAPSRPPTLCTNLDGAYPSYFVFGPMAFSSATGELMAALTRGDGGGQWLGWLAGMRNPLVTRASEPPAFDGEQLVIVPSPFFPHKLSKGYSNPGLHVVKAVNGKAIKNLGHLVELLRDSKDEFITIEFHGRGETLVFPHTEARNATDEILSDNGVRSQGTPDVMAIWNAKPAR